MKRLIFGAVIAASLGIGLAGPTRAAGAPPSRHAALVKATNSFGYWMTYGAGNPHVPPSRLLKPAYVNAKLNSFIAPSYLRQHIYHNIGGVTGDMHLMNIPDGYRFSINRYDGVHATETIHWLFGSNPHTPIDRLSWTYTAAGWKITNAVFLRIS